MPAAAKNAWLFPWYLCKKCIFLKTFEGEMLIKTQLTNRHQIFMKITLYSQDFYKSVQNPDDTSQEEP